MSKKKKALIILGALVVLWFSYNVAVINGDNYAKNAQNEGIIMQLNEEIGRCNQLYNSGFFANAGGQQQGGDGQMQSLHQCNQRAIDKAEAQK